MPSAGTQEIIEAVERQLSAVRSAEELMTFITRLLHERMLEYNWVGFYMIEEQAGREPMLILGPYRGAVTPHTRIPLNRGICGAAASSGQTVVVDDVSTDARYLACSLETKSEIVVPIFAKGKVVGELDIDSHFPSAFQAADREIVEYCAAQVGKYLEASRA